MSDTPLTVSIVTVPSLVLCGLYVRTSMQNASEDCPRLWEQTFLPRMAELCRTPSHECQGESYGISVMDGTAPHEFTYWAAMPYGPETPLPEGMSRIELQGGSYARCRVPSLQQLGEAYTYLYMRWRDPDGAFAPDMTLPCFERYGAAYLERGELDIFMPLRADSENG